MSYKKVNLQGDLEWIRNNEGIFDHIAFFNRFPELSRRAVTARFKMVVYTMSQERQEEFLGALEHWQQTEESRLFWRQRHDSDGNSVITTTSTTTTDTSTATITTTTTSSSSMSESAFEELKKFFTVNLKCPDEDSRYMIEGIDLSYSFNCFQQHVLDVLPTGKLAFETHIHHILSMSSIMLIFKGDNASSEAYNLIPEAKKTIYAGISSSAQFSRQLLIQALDIIQGVAIDGSINRKVGSLRLLELSSTESSDLGQRILLYLHRAVQTLTKDNSLNPINDEADLCGRFILPLLQTLSDELDSTENVFFKLNNSKNHECGVAPMLNLSERRPDGVIKWLSQSGQKTIGFMETKTISISHQTSKINIDLIRLGLMGKNAIDVYNLKSVLLIQAVGMNLTFYLFQKKTVDDYMMVELDHLAFPQSLVDLPSLIGNMDRVVRLLDIFKRECFIVQPTQNETRPTVRSPLMNQVALSSTSRKRKNDYPHSYC